MSLTIVIEKKWTPNGVVFYPYRKEKWFFGLLTTYTSIVSDLRFKGEFLDDELLAVFSSFPSDHFDTKEEAIAHAEKWVKWRIEQHRKETFPVVSIDEEYKITIEKMD